MKSKSLLVGLVGVTIIAAVLIPMVLQNPPGVSPNSPETEKNQTRPVQVRADGADVENSLRHEGNSGEVELPAQYKAGANALWDVSPTPLEKLAKLGYAYDARAIADLILDQSKDSDVRMLAAFSAAQLADYNLLPTLYQAAIEPDISVRTAAISAMGFMPSEKTIPVLKKVLAEDLGEMPRSSAVIVLRQIGTEEAGIVLAHVALNEFESPQTRLSAIDGVEDIDSSKIDGQLIPLLESKNPDIRLKTSVLLTSKYDSRYLPRLVESLSEDADLAIFARAVETIEQITGQKFSNPITDGPQESRRQILAWWESEKSGYKSE